MIILPVGDASPPHLWFLELKKHQLDFAGVDGLQLAKALFGEGAGRIAPFQSLETTIDNQPCSLLRLCEGNFRLRIQGDAAELEQKIMSSKAGLRVWVKQCEWMGAIALPEAIGLEQLPQIATPKPPHRLQGLGVNCAAPARIDAVSVLIWRHQLFGQPAFELQTAVQDLDTIKVKLQNGAGS